MKKKASEHLYKILYKLEHNEKGVPGSEVPEGMGATDALFAASILYPPDGSLSVMFFSKDGRTGKELEDIEWFKVWILLANRLAKSKTLDPVRKEIAKTAWDIVCQTIMSGGRN